MKENIIHSRKSCNFHTMVVYVLSNCNNNISVWMHINLIASIWRAVLGLARYEGVPACHGPCLGLIIDLSCQHGTARCADRA